MTAVSIQLGDCLHIPLDDDAADLVFTSPPYEAARTYGIDFNLSGEEWVEWCIPRFMECLRVCRGVVVWVVAGRTRNYRWTAAPALLTADLHRAGVCLRNPPTYKRNGIPGAGGPDWLRPDYEWTICATKRRGKLPWSNNTAMGHPPKCPPGGAPSSRLPDGRRYNDRLAERRPDGSRDARLYKPPKLANPGNVIDCGAVGGGNMGDKLAHENEAPFPEKLAEHFVRPFCPPGGLVVDPMCGSGTSLAVAVKHGRRAFGMDIRQSQVDLAQRRVDQCAQALEEETP